MSATDRGPAGGALTRGTLVSACLAVCLAQICISIPGTLNGLFQQDLHPIGSQLTWISDATLIAVAVPELTFGVLGDLFGRKRLLVIGAALMVVGEIVSAAAPGVYVLWIGQGIAGLGAAALFATSLAMLAAGTRTRRDRARTIAVWAGVLSLGAVIAPVLGGITGNYGSWRWSFIVIAGLSAVSALVSYLLATDSRAPEGRALDIWGQVTLAVGVFALLYGVIQGPSEGWTSTTIVAAFVIAALFLVLFLSAERKARSPLLRLDLFRRRPFAIASVVTVVGMFSFLGSAYATSIRLGPIQHQSPLRVAVPFIFLQGPCFLLIPLTGYLLERVSPRWVLGAGFTFMAAGQFWSSTLPIEDTALTSLVVPIGLIGIGFALAVSAITTTTVNTVPIRFAGMASATTGLLRDFAFTLGPAVIGAVALSRAAHDFTASLAGARLPADQLAAATGVAQAGGPLAVNGLPPGAPGSAAHPLAFAALGHGYAIGYVVCGVAAAVAAALTVLAMRSGTSDDEVVEAEMPAVVSDDPTLAPA